MISEEKAKFVKLFDDMNLDMNDPDVKAAIAFFALQYSVVVVRRFAEQFVLALENTKNASCDGKGEQYESEEEMEV